MKLTELQKDQLRSKGIPTDKLEEQLDRFKNGFPTLRLIRAAVIDDGIISLENIDSEALNNFYDSEKETLDIIKFVPASGAATRMFKFIYEFLQNYDPSRESVNSFINKNKATQLFTFFAALEKFPFFQNIKDSLQLKYTDWSAKSDGEKKLLFVRR